MSCLDVLTEGKVRAHGFGTEAGACPEFRDHKALWSKFSAYMLVLAHACVCVCVFVCMESWSVRTMFR